MKGRFAVRKVFVAGPLLSIFHARGVDDFMPAISTAYSGRDSLVTSSTTKPFPGRVPTRLCIFIPSEDCVNIKVLYDGKPTRKFNLTKLARSGEWVFAVEYDQSHVVRVARIVLGPSAKTGVLIGVYINHSTYALYYPYGARHFMSRGPFPTIDRRRGLPDDSIGHYWAYDARPEGQRVVAPSAPEVRYPLPTLSGSGQASGVSFWSGVLGDSTVTFRP